MEYALSQDMPGGRSIHHQSTGVATKLGAHRIKMKYCQVNMVIYQAKCQHTMAESLNTFLKKKEHAIMIFQ